MDKKECCKSCESLGKDNKGYYCKWGKSEGLKEEWIRIDDIEKSLCEMYN